MAVEKPICLNCKSPVTALSSVELPIGHKGKFTRTAPGLTCPSCDGLIALDAVPAIPKARPANCPNCSSATADPLVTVKLPIMTHKAIQRTAACLCCRDCSAIVGLNQ